MDAKYNEFQYLKSIHLIESIKTKIRQLYAYLYVLLC
jgi:hypothetical protein